MILNLIKFHDIDSYNYINLQENGELYIRVEYISMVQIGQSYEVDSYFSMHRGCHVTLYQDTKVLTNQNTALLDN